MAVVWQKNTRDKCYQVRTAGNSVRLYTNGVFHSQYNPTRPVAGHLWDLLSLPAFFSEQEQVKRVLVLGVGGGAVIKQLNCFLTPQKIVGVDLDRTHLQVAKRWFKVGVKNVELVHADAVDFVREYQGEKFDLIVEDLFGDVAQDDACRPCRAVAVDVSWLVELRAQLALAGVLAFNLEDMKQAKSVAGLVKASDLDLSSGAALTHPSYQNVIAAFSPFELSKKGLMGNLRQHRLLDQRYASCRLNFGFKKLM